MSQEPKTSQARASDHNACCYRDRCIAEVATLCKAIDGVMVGGNHLANILVHKLSPGFSDDYPPTMDSLLVLEAIGAGFVFDVWCCWSRIMQASDAVKFYAEMDNADQR